MKQLLFSALAISTLATPAFADFRVCNHSGVRTWMAIAEKIEGGYTTKGWTEVPAGGACKTLVRGTLRSQYYYVYGRDEEGLEITGNDRFCTVEGRNFNLLNADEACTGPGREWQSFLEVDTGDDTTFTFDIYDR